MTFVRRYGKSLAAVLVLVAIAVFQKLSGDNRIEPVEWVSIAIAAVNAVGVYLVPLVPQAPWTKTAIALALSVLQVATTVILGGFGADEVLLVLITLAGAAGIAVAPAASAPTRTAVGWGSDAATGPVTSRLYRP